MFIGITARLPQSYGGITMGRMHSDAQFAGSSSVPAHVEMMGFLGIGNNPMVGCTVACAVDVAQALSASKCQLSVFRKPSHKWGPPCAGATFSSDR